jgi:hypothetical protein
LLEQIFDGKGSSYFLILSAVRGIVEKHGGSMKIDEKENTFVLGIPQNRKAECLIELEQVIGPDHPFDDFSPLFAFDSRT